MSGNSVALYLMSNDLKKPDTIANNDAENDTLIDALYELTVDEHKLLKGK